MLLALKIAILLNLLFIAVQDFKERKVYALLFLVLSVLLISYRLQTTFLKVFLSETLLNLLLVVVLVVTLIIYSKYNLKTSLFEVFGLGDLLFFIVISLGFATLPFYVFFIFSLFFSLVLYLVLKNTFKDKMVPLAGLQSVFFILVFILNWIFHFSIF